MRNVIIGLVAGGVVGVVIGATVVAPRLEPPVPPLPQVEQSAEQAGPPTAESAPRMVQAADPSATFTLKTAAAFKRSLPVLGTMVGRLEKSLWRVSGGTVRLRFDDDAKPVKTSQMFDAVATGKLDVAFASPTLWGEKVPGLRLFGAIPFGPSADEYLAWIYFGGGREIYRAILHKRNVHGIFCGILPPEGAGWFRYPVRSLDSLSGLRMAVNGLPARVLARIGVDPYTMDSAEVFAALEKGDVDAAEFSMPAVDLELGLHKLIKNYYLPGWHQPATLFDLIINLDRWTALPETAKARIEAVCGDNIRHGLAQGEAVQFQALKRLQAEDVEIRRWPPEVLKALRAAWDEVAAEEAASDRDFRKAWLSLTAFRRDYGIWKELGHP